MEPDPRGREAGKACRECVGGVVAANLAACLCLVVGVYLVSVLVFSRIAVEGISSQPASVQEGGADVQSLRYIIFGDAVWHPPSPPSGR